MPATQASYDQRRRPSSSSMAAPRQRRKMNCACSMLATLALVVLPESAAADVTGTATVMQQRARHAYAPRELPNASIQQIRRNETATATGRYGHSAVYLPYKKQVLFIGGQIGSRGSFFTNDVLALDMALPYDSRNPSSSSDFAGDLPPTAWAASTVDAQQRVWVIGGITEDCEDEATAYLLEDGNTWKAVGRNNESNRPPRRRQAQAVALDDGSMLSSIYVFGGIAEAHTCSLETVGYLAMDVWNATDPDNAGAAVTVPWKDQIEVQKSLPNGPPVSDYAAVRLHQSDSILYIGGQDASGRMLEMDRILQYNTTSKLWSTHKIGGKPPEPRLGLTATALLDGRVLVYGGAGSAEQTFPDIHVLDASAPTKWTWKKPTLAASSESTSARAWHTATLTDEGIIVFAYGLDASTGETSNDITFLKTTDSLQDWSWSTTNPLAVAGSVKPHVLPAEPSTFAPQVLAQTDSSFLNDTSPRPHNPKADLIGALPGGDNPNGSDETATSETVSVKKSAASSYVSTSRTRSAAHPTTTNVDSVTSPFSGSDKESASTQEARSGTNTKVVAGSVTAAFLLVLGAGAIGLYMRRRASKADESGATMAEADDNSPPVSHLLYTRQAPRRMLSLGSSIHSNRKKSSTSRRHGHRQQQSESFQPLSEEEARETVDEFGRLGFVSPQQPGFSLREETLPEAQSRVAAIDSRPGIEHAMSSDTMHSDLSRASVASYPFLTSLPMLAIESDVEPLRQQNGNTRTLLRSHSMSTASTASSRSSHSRADDGDIGGNSLKAVNVPLSTPLPSREFTRPVSIHEDPFADFEEIRETDLSSAQAIYMRAPDPKPGYVGR